MQWNEIEKRLVFLDVRSKASFPVMLKTLADKIMIEILAKILAVKTWLQAISGMTGNLL